MYQQVAETDGTVLSCVKDLERGCFIPFDPANTDYQHYLKWLEEGNTPLSADANVQQELFQQE